jgi:putative transposase
MLDNKAMTDNPSYRGYRFPRDIIAHAVWLYHRYTLSFRDVEDLLAERGITVSYETVRQWCKNFGPQYARRIKKRQGPRGDQWFLDEVVVNIQGKRRYLWRAVDQDGDLIEILVQKRKDTQAARRFFRKLLRSQTEVPIEITTDKLGSYAAAKRDVMPSVPHCHDQYANNRAEVSHEPIREQERQMRGFRSDGHAQRFLSAHGQVTNLFRVGRHLLRAPNYRELRSRAFYAWSQVTCVR